MTIDVQLSQAEVQSLIKLLETEIARLRDAFDLIAQPVQYIGWPDEPVRGEAEWRMDVARRALGMSS